MECPKNLGELPDIECAPTANIKAKSETELLLTNRYYRAHVLSQAGYGDFNDLVEYPVVIDKQTSK